MKKRAPKQLDHFLDLTSAARLYPLCRRTLRTYIATARLPAFRVGGKLIVKRADLERLLTASPVSAEKIAA